jgi:hypothetical protein
MTRMVGRRLVDDAEPKKAFLVMVSRRWPWQQENFYSEKDIQTKVSEGCLMITVDEVTHVFAPKNWKKIVSKKVPIRERI